MQRAHKIIVKWADLEDQGVLSRKETSLDAEFLLEVFGDALGYKSPTEGTEAHELERQYTVPDVGTADAAIGTFSASGHGLPVAVVELKGASADLDFDRFNGRTPVQQGWDYLNALPECTWVIVSNFSRIRLYHRDHGSRAYEEFTLRELRRIERFREFYYLLGRGGLLRTPLESTPRAEVLLNLTGERQREVGDDLYDTYSRNRLALIDHLHTRLGRPIDKAIAIAQKLLDRIIFIAFCEDRGLLPEKIIERTYREVSPLARVTNPRWRNFVDLFHAVDKGHKTLRLAEGYNGGLFQHDPDVDELQLDDDWTDFFQNIGSYDFRDEVNVDVLGHLFEKSITELERLRAGGFFENGNGGPPTESRMPASAQRKRFGVYYTPREFTAFIVQSTVGELLEERFGDLGRKNGVDPDRSAEHPSDAMRCYWNDCLRAMRDVKICDPACGSGAFLIATYDFLEEQYAEIIHNLILDGDPAAEEALTQIPDMILSDNLFGVDLSPEAVEITQLALWIRSARRGQTLADLSKNIVCGNSLVGDTDVDPRAMTWETTFPEIFRREPPGFDCVIGNPPWERLKLQEREFFSLSAPKIASAVNAADRRIFIEQLESENPELHVRYVQAKRMAERALDYARNSGALSPYGQGRHKHLRALCRTRPFHRRPPWARGAARSFRDCQRHDDKGFLQRTNHFRRVEENL